MDVYQDRRRCPRVESRAHLQYRNLRALPESPSGTLIKDISEGGVKFVVGEFLSLATRLIVEITLPNSPKTIKAISKVAWVKKLPAGDNYEVGNQFLDMTKEDKKLISTYISAILSTQS